MNRLFSTVSLKCRPVLAGVAIVAIAMGSIHTSTALGNDLDPTKTRYSLPLPEPPTIDGLSLIHI